MPAEREMIAHVKDGKPHGLEEHLREVARLAGDFAATFRNEDWAHIAGIWHDLGKYKSDFQEYIRRVTGYERDEAEDGGPGNSLTACERISQSDSQFSNSLLENWAGAHSLRGGNS